MRRSARRACPWFLCLVVFCGVFFLAVFPDFMFLFCCGGGGFLFFSFFSTSGITKKRLPPASPPPPSQSRPNIFDIEIRRPDLLYKAVIEVDERVVLDKAGEGGWETTTNSGASSSSHKDAVIQGLTGEGVRVVKEPDLALVRESLQAVLDQGITSLAVVFMHR